MYKRKDEEAGGRADILYRDTLVVHIKIGGIAQRLEILSQKNSNKCQTVDYV